jgi:hypothetical protein
MPHTEIFSQFVGRKMEIELLKRRLTDLKEGYRQNLALLGNPCMGKSLLLQYFLYNLDDEDVTAIYVDFENKDFHYIFPKFIGSLLYSYAKNHKLPLHDDISLLIESTKKTLPHTTDVIKKLMQEFEKGKYEDCFLGLMLLPEIFTNETGKFCVLVLDEFQNLEELLGESAFQELGKKIMTQKRCLYILSSSYPLLAKKILSEKLSLLFGNFETIFVDAFDPAVCQTYIDLALKEKKIGAQLRNFLIDFTGGYPLYLQLVSHEMISLSALHNQTEIYMPILTQSIENTIFNRWGVISRHFELVINDLCAGKNNRIVTDLLMSMANGRHKIEDILEEVKASKNLIRQKITKLLEVGVLVKNGNYFYIKDKLFRYWIKFVYQPRLKDVEFAPDKARRQFKEELNRAVENFKQASRQDFTSRIIDLLHCFENEALDLNGRTYKLPSFSNLEAIKIKNESNVNLDVIKASTPDDLWFIILKKENFYENDVNLILSEMKRLGQKPQRCLVISLTNLDENARLKALQERFWIWNEDELNTLLTLFDKPYILR